jgi:hypothetical protein
MLRSYYDPESDKPTPPTAQKALCKIFLEA